MCTLILLNVGGWVKLNEDDDLRQYEKVKTRRRELERDGRVTSD